MHMVGTELPFPFLYPNSVSGHQCGRYILYSPLQGTAIATVLFRAFFAELSAFEAQRAIVQYHRIPLGVVRNDWRRGLHQERLVPRQVNPRVGQVYLEVLGTV